MYRLEWFVGVGACRIGINMRVVASIVSELDHLSRGITFTSNLPAAGTKICPESFVMPSLFET